MDMLLRMGAWYDSRAMRRRADGIDVKRYGPVQQARREGNGERKLQRITAEELDERRFMDDEGNVLDPLVTPFVLMPDPGACGSGRPCRLWIVTKGALGYLPHRGGDGQLGRGGEGLRRRQCADGLDPGGSGPDHSLFDGGRNGIARCRPPDRPACTPSP